MLARASVIAATGAVMAALSLASPSRAQPPCVPGSIGPSGCFSIRPGDERSERPGVEPAPDLGPIADPTPQRAIERQSPTRSGARRPPRLDPTAPRDPTVLRDPRAVQSFQAPYAFD